MAMARNDEDNEQHNKTDDEGQKTCHSKVQDVSQEDNIKTEFWSKMQQPKFAWEN